MPESPEAVAKQLLDKIAEVENWHEPASGGSDQRWKKTRAEILDTYAECLRAVKGTPWRSSATRP